jgi:hypothetical protein
MSINFYYVDFIGKKAKAASPGLGGCGFPGSKDA